LIFGGFALLALSAVLSTYNYVSPGYPGTGFSNDAQAFLSMFSSLFAAGGWWFLCQLEAKDSVQESLITRAYVFLGLQFVASCVAQFLRARGVLFIDRLSAPYWLTGLGFGVGAAGFLLAAYTIRRVDEVAADT
jgi:hypothetical protein